MSETPERTPLSSEAIAYLEELNGYAEPSMTSKWCDIRNTFTVGTKYTGKVTVGKYGGEATFTINSDGTVNFLKVIANGKDVTKIVHDAGGQKVPVIQAEKSWCKTHNYYLGWELTGSAAGAICKMVSEATSGFISPQNLQLWGRWSHHDDPKRHFYFWSKVAWFYTELTY